MAQTALYKYYRNKNTKKYEYYIHNQLLLRTEFKLQSFSLNKVIES